jgi:hypothetical protein
MRSVPRLSLILVAISLQISPPAKAQTVSARLMLFQDPVPVATPGELVLGSTTLEQARQLFPDAPNHQGPLPYSGNPQYLKHEPDREIGGAVVELRYSFFLGRGRAVLLFDEHQRLVSIEQAQFAYNDPDNGKLIIETGPWDSAAVSRADFREHYPRTTGEWSDPVHYRIQGMIGDCLGVTAWFYQDKGHDLLGSLGYDYTCPTKAQLDPVDHPGREHQLGR